MPLRPLGTIDVVRSAAAARDGSPGIAGVRRRGFLSLAAGGGAFVLGVQLAPRRAGAAPSPLGFVPNAFIRIDADGTITLTAPNPDMGQGTRTTLPMLLAEELDAGLDQVRIEQGGLDPRLGDQRPGGSESVPKAWEPLRHAGATARHLLVTAAAAHWGVPAAELRTERAAVIHTPSGRRIGYGALADAAARLPLPEAKDVQPKAPASYRLIGHRQVQADAEAIARGAPLFCLDQPVPAARVAVYEKCPVFGGRVVEANLDVVRGMPGVQAAFVVEGSADPLRQHPERWIRGLQPGVAIVARDTWSALQAKRALRVRWDGDALTYAGHSSVGYRAEAERQRAARAGEIWRDDGDVEAALAGAALRVEAWYEYPILAHTTMEPMSCIAIPLPGGALKLITPSQWPDLVPTAVETVLGVPARRVQLEVPRLGGSFGRRFEVDFALEASAIALRAGVPVKLLSTREDDMRHDFYRPFGWQHFHAGLDASGRIVAWDTQRIDQAFRNPVAPKGRASLFPARFIANYRMRYAVVDSNLPDGAYRAPGANAAAFTLECFLDELAHAAGHDPLAFRLALLGEDRELDAPAFSPTRMKAVLRLAAAQAGWGRPLPRGEGLGIAACHSHQGYVAHVVHAAVTPQGAVRVRRVTSAVDVGRIVDPSGAENQVQGAVVDALSGTLLQQVTIERGAVVQGNFDDNPHLRLPDVPPRIDVHFVPSERPPTGLGEPPYPPLPPALCNAVFAACGHRVRSLPLRLHDLRWRADDERRAER